MKLAPEILADKHLVNKILRSKRCAKHKGKNRKELTHEGEYTSSARFSRITKTRSRVFYNGNLDDE